MKTKSTFLTILFSFLPGAGHMYLGLIKQGIQLMVLFFGTIFLSSLTVSFFGNVFSLLLFFLPVFFCYSIFGGPPADGPGKSGHLRMAPPS